VHRQFDATGRTLGSAHPHNTATVGEVGRTEPSRGRARRVDVGGREECRS
jgi:hypothetical protein